MTETSAGTARVCIVIDPNVRARGNQTYARFDDVEMPHSAGDLRIGMKVFAVETESNMGTDATVADIDPNYEFIYLAVEWRGWRDAGEGG